MGISYAERYSSAGSRHITAADLGGKEHRRTIFRIGEETLTKERDDGSRYEVSRPVLYFDSDSSARGLVLNKVNGDTAAAGFGDDMEEWIGQSIVLYPATTHLRGQVVPCVRIRVPVEQRGGVTADQVASAGDDRVRF